MNTKKLVMSSGVANTFEWYDYALFGHFAQVIGTNFFPSDDPNTELLQAFMVFAIGYLMRPIGGIFFGIIGDKFGRKFALSSAIMCMAIPTAALGFLPTYEQWGIYATILMIAMRMLQGLSMGGALTGSVAFVIEHSPKNQRGIFGSVSMASICLGILLGSVASWLIKTAFTEEQVIAWAWRIPFIVGVAIYFVGNYIKKNTVETPMFKKAQAQGEVLDSPLKTTFKYYWKDMVLSILINATGSIIFYLEAVYLITYLKKERGFTDFEVGALANMCYVVMIFVTIFSGWLSDIIGRRRIFVANLILIICTMPVLLNILETGDFASVVTAQLFLAIMAAIYIGPEPALQAEFYPTEVRNTALSVSYNTATSIFGGTAPYIIESLRQSTGSIASSVYYILISAFVGLFALYFYKNRAA